MCRDVQKESMIFSFINQTHEVSGIPFEETVDNKERLPFIEEEISIIARPKGKKKGHKELILKDIE